MAVSYGMKGMEWMPGEDIIHVLPQDYIVDREPGIKDPIGMSGIQLEGNFHIITGQIAAAKNIYKCVNKAGLEVADLILEPLASFSSPALPLRSPADAFRVPSEHVESMPATADSSPFAG